MVKRQKIIAAMAIGHEYDEDDNIVDAQTNTTNEHK